MQIRLENVSHIYAPKTPFETVALSDINFVVGEGEFIGLIGHTGSGKSTLVQILNGLIIPTSGYVYIDNKEIRKYRSLMDIRRKIGIVFQYPEDQFFEDTVFNEVAYSLKNMGFTEEIIEKRVNKALSLVGLEPTKFRDRSPFALSGGERRRVAIATILAMKPELVIFDEPSVGLDPESKKRIFTLIYSLYKSGISVIMISHDMDIIASFSNRVIVMNNSKIVLDGKPYVVFIENREYLLDIGLDIPQISKILLDLKRCGYNPNLDIFTLEGAKEEIRKVLNV